MNETLNTLDIFERAKQAQRRPKPGDQVKARDGTVYRIAPNGAYVKLTKKRSKKERQRERKTA